MDWNVIGAVATVAVPLAAVFWSRIIISERRASALESRVESKFQSLDNRMEGKFGRLEEKIETFALRLEELRKYFHAESREFHGRLVAIAAISHKVPLAEAESLVARVIK